GLKTFNANDNGAGGSWQIGTTFQPVGLGSLSSWDGFVINLINADGEPFGVFVDISLAAAGFTGNDTITVNATRVQDISDDPHDILQGDTVGIAAGSPTKGFAHWVVNSAAAGGGGNFNNIALGADGNSSAKTLVITDDGSNTIVYASDASGSSSGDWKNLTTIDASATTGTLIITGGETDDDTNSDGLLAANHTALTTVLGGTGADIFDLSAFSGPTSQLHITGGGNAGTTVELSNTEVTHAVGFGAWSGVPNLFIV